MEPPPEDAGTSVRDFVLVSLHRQYPWLKTAAIEKMASACFEVVAGGVEEQLPVMQTSKERTGLLSLAPEIRNQIYNLALIKRPMRYEAGKPKDDPDQNDYTDIIDISEVDAVRPNSTLSWTRQPALTRTCRQIREETLPIYYGGNRFGCIDRRSPYRDILTRLENEEAPGKISGGMRKVDHRMLGAGGIWLRMIGKRNADMIKHFTVYISRSRWDTECPPVHEELEPHAGATVKVMRDCLRRMGTSLPDGVVMMAKPRRLLTDTQISTRPWKEIDLALH